MCTLNACAFGLWASESFLLHGASYIHDILDGVSSTYQLCHPGVACIHEVLYDISCMHDVLDGVPCFMMYLAYMTHLMLMHLVSTYGLSYVDVSCIHDISGGLFCFMMYVAYMSYLMVYKTLKAYVIYDVSHTLKTLKCWLQKFSLQKST